MCFFFPVLPLHGKAAYIPLKREPTVDMRRDVPKRSRVPLKREATVESNQKAERKNGAETFCRCHAQRRNKKKNVPINYR